MNFNKLEAALAALQQAHSAKVTLTFAAADYRKAVQATSKAASELAPFVDMPVANPSLALGLLAEKEAQTSTICRAAQTALAQLLGGTQGNNVVQVTIDGYCTTLKLSNAKPVKDAHDGLVGILYLEDANDMGTWVVLIYKGSRPSTVQYRIPREDQGY